MTRAMETAAIVGRRVGLDPVVAIDLREWLPDRNMAWSTPEDVETAYAAMLDSAAANDTAPSGTWETMSELRRRALGVLRRFADRDGGAVVAVCHAVLIHAVTGCSAIDHCELREVGPTG